MRTHRLSFSAILLSLTLTACGGGGGGGGTGTVAPSNLTYTTSSASYTRDVTITSNTPSNSGGAVVSYSVSPSLPAGLNLDTSTGVISGTPTTVTSIASYTVTATNSGGSTNANVSITVVGWTGTKQLGVSAKQTLGISVATDANGNVYVAGQTDGGLDGNTLTGITDFIVTKYDSTGVKQYTRQLGVSAARTVGRSVATDANGNVYVAGYTYGGLDGNTLTGSRDFFVTKYDSTGVKQYTRQLGVAAKDTAVIGVATDANGNVYVVGTTYGGLDGNTLTGISDFFITKYDSTGVKQYTRQLGVAAKDTGGSGVATDANGNVYVAGYTYGGLDGNTLTGSRDFFVTKYDSTGVKQYTRQLGVTAKSTGGSGVATDVNGNVYVTGQTRGGLDGNTLTGISDFFVTKYDSTGVKQYTRQLGAAAATTVGNSVATDANGNVYVAGQTNRGLDGNTLTGTADSFVTKYDSTGVKQYTRQLGVAAKPTSGFFVATDANGNVYVAGSTSGGLDGNTLTGTHDFFVTKYDSTGVKQ